MCITYRCVSNSYRQVEPLVEAQRKSSTKISLLLSATLIVCERTYNYLTLLRLS